MNPGRLEAQLQELPQRSLVDALLGLDELLEPGGNLLEGHLAQVGRLSEARDVGQLLASWFFQDSGCKVEKQLEMTICGSYSYN